MTSDCTWPCAVALRDEVRVARERHRAEREQERAEHAVDLHRPVEQEAAQDDDAGAHDVARRCS